MNRQTKIISAALALTVVGTVILGLTYYELHSGPGFNSEFYANPNPQTAKPFSYDDLASALKYVDADGMVNYKALKDQRNRLDSFCRLIANLDRKGFDKWPRKEKVAFWINVYNALTLKAIIDNYPIKASLLKSLTYPKNSIRQIPGVWDKRQFLVMGQKMTLNQVEHGVLRKKFKEPRIHVALVCAAMSCPPLRSVPYVSKKLDQHFDDQTRKFLSQPTKFRVDKKAKKVYLSKIFQWFGKDFVKIYKPAQGFTGYGETQRSVLNFVSKYISPEDAKYLRTGKYKLVYLDYDWTLNEQKSKKDSDKE